MSHIQKNLMTLQLENQQTGNSIVKQYSAMRRNGLLINQQLQWSTNALCLWKEDRFERLPNVFPFTCHSCKYRIVRTYQWLPRDGTWVFCRYQPGENVWLLELLFTLICSIVIIQLIHFLTHTKIYYKGQILLYINYTWTTVTEKEKYGGST